MEYSRHEIAALAGVKVTVRRYIQPTLKAGDPDREPAGEHAGTVTHIDGAGRLVLDSCPEAIWPEPAFLGGSPQHGTSRWLVTEITRDGEEGGLTMSDLNAGEHDGGPWAQGNDGDDKEAAQNAAWHREVAVAAAAWSASAQAAEDAVRQLWHPQAELERIAPDQLSGAEEKDVTAALAMIREGLAALRRVTDSVAWRAARAAGVADDLAAEVPGDR